MNRLLHRLLAAFGIVLLALSATQHWFSVPQGFSSTSDDATIAVMTESPQSLVVFKMGSILVALATAGSLLLGNGRRVRITITSLWLAALVTFPYWAIIDDTHLGADAAWMQSQYENLTWLGGDLSTSFEYTALEGKSKIYVVDTPRSVRIVPLPTWHISDISPIFFQDLLSCLGYNNTFCQFVRRGWVFAALGTFFLLLIASADESRVRSRYLGRGLGVFGVAVVIAAVAAWSRPLAASGELAAAESSVALGDYDQASLHLRRAITIYPTIEHDTRIVAQLGLTDYFGGQLESPEARLFRANLTERSGRYAQATAIYLSLLETLPRTCAVHHEACRAVLRSAVNCLNGGANEQAIVELRRVLDAQPTNIKANYALGLALLRAGRGEELDRIVEKQCCVLTCFQFPNKKAVLADAHRQRLMAALAAGETEQATALLTKVKKP